MSTNAPKRLEQAEVLELYDAIIEKYVTGEWFSDHTARELIKVNDISRSSIGHDFVFVRNISSKFRKQMIASALKVLPENDDSKAKAEVMADELVDRLFAIVFEPIVAEKARNMGGSEGVNGIIEELRSKLQLNKSKEA